MNNVLSIHQFDTKKIEEILSRSGELESMYEKGNLPELLKGKVVACIFFEPSTRTRLSFETAALRLGAQVISAENANGSSSAFKGETMEDTGRMLSAYADAVVMRHPTEGSLSRAASVSTVPFLNAGDGSKEHPTQALLDLYTIKKEKGRLDNLSIVFVGDLVYGRTVHSLIPALSSYEGNTFTFVSPESLKLPDEYKNGISYTETDSLEETIASADVVYMTRVQKERFADVSEYEKVKDVFVFKKEHLQKMKDDAILMHPLPRVGEIDPEVDSDSRAAYFRQAKNGLFVRMALLLYVFGV